MKNLILILLCTGLLSTLSAQKFHVGIKSTGFLKVESIDGTIEINDSLFIITIKGENNRNKVKKYDVCKRDSMTVYLPLASDTVIVMISKGTGEKNGYGYNTTMTWWHKNGIIEYYCRKEE